MMSCEEYHGITDKMRGEDRTEAAEPVEKRNEGRERVSERQKHKEKGSYIIQNGAQRTVQRLFEWARAQSCEKIEGIASERCFGDYRRHGRYCINKSCLALSARRDAGLSRHW